VIALILKGTANPYYMWYIKLKMKRFSPWLFLALLITSIVVSVLPTPKASAFSTSTTGEWIDGVVILVDGKPWQDNNPFDGDHNFKSERIDQDGGGPCEHSLTIKDFGSNGTKASLQPKKVDGGECKDDGKSVEISLSKPENRNTNAYRIDEQTIFMPRYFGLKEGSNYFTTYHSSTYGHGVFKQTANKDVFVLIDSSGAPCNPDGECSKITLSKNKQEARLCNRAGVCSTTGETSSLNISSSQPNKSVYSSVDGNTTSAVNNATGGTSDPNANPSFQCENKIGVKDVALTALAPITGGLTGMPAVGKGINWLMCTIIRAVNGTINLFDKLIIRELDFPSSDLEIKTGATGGYYQAWSAFRYLAVGLLVLIGLLMVISQMLGIGLFDAYTVKKILPRILAAAILITLSWSLCKIAIDVVNILGGSLRSIMYAPFGGPDTIAKNISSTVQSSTAANSVAFAGAAIGGYFLFATSNFMVILSLALPALVAVLVGFFFVVMRKVVIVLLVMTAPIAIVAYILPGTNKVWNFWRESFTRALLMYPLIIAFLSIGRIFASVVTQQKTPGVVEDQALIIVAMIAYFGPYFAIPVTYKFAGNILGTVTGAISDRSRGLMDRNRKMRQQNQAKTWGDTKAGHRFNPTGRLGGLNTSMQTGSMLGKAGLDPRRMRSRINAARGVLAGSEIGELLDKHPDIAGVKNDDDLAKITQTAKGRAEIEKALIDTKRFGAQGSVELADATARVERAQRAGSQAGVRGAMAIARANSGTGYDTEADMHESIIQAANGDRQLEGQLLAAARSGSERGRRPDLAAAGHVDQAEAMNDLRATIGDPTSSAHTAARERVNARLRQKAFQAVGAHGIVSGRTNAVESIVTQLGEDFTAARDAGDMDKSIEYASQLTSLRGAMGSASPEVRQKIMATLVKSGIDPSKVNATTGQALSTDEQLGDILAGISGRDAKELTQEVRTRAGAYDVGGGNLTPEEIAARRAAIDPDKTT
jgi:hypothetical protein